MVKSRSARTISTAGSEDLVDVIKPGVVATRRAGGEGDDAVECGRSLSEIVFERNFIRDRDLDPAGDPLDERLEVDGLEGRSTPSRNRREFVNQWEES